MGLSNRARSRMTMARYNRWMLVVNDGHNIIIVPLRCVR